MIPCSRQILSRVVGLLTLVIHAATIVPSLDAQFETYEGAFVRTKSGTISILTVDGEKTFRLVKPNEDVPEMGVGVSTSISVRGTEKVPFLKPGMLVAFEAEQDKNNKSNVAIEQLDLIPKSSKVATLRELIAEIDAATGNSLYRFTAEVDQIDIGQSHLFVIVRNGRKSDRYEFLFDVDKTRVVYDLPDLKLAQVGEPVFVRCLPPRNRISIATEVRVTRSSAFPDEPAAQTDIAQQGLPTPDADDEPEMPIQVPGDDPQNSDVGPDNEFDFPEGQDPAKIDLGIPNNLLDDPDDDEPDKNADVVPKLPVPEEDFDDLPRPKKIKGRRWFKIN